VDPVDFSSATGFGNGATVFQINNITLNAEVTNPFDPARPQIITYTYNVPFDFDLATLHLVPRLGDARPVDSNPGTNTNCASLSISVTDAMTGNPISGATASVNLAPAPSTSNTSGIIAVSSLMPGSTSVAVSASGYNSSSRVVELDCTSSQPITTTISLSPPMPVANSARVILTWGQNPSDLDSHLTGPTADSTGTADETNRYHVYYGSRTRECYTATPTTCVTRLDLDDTSGFGPETITIAPPEGSQYLRPGIYRYTVHHYSGSGTISTSGTVVDLTVGDQASRTFTPPEVTGSYNTTWTVFELMASADGSVTVLPVNTLSSSSASSVRTRTGLGAVENGVDFARLPAK
jgi:uncharacterized protein YfaP (DUF2135 family)